MYFEVLLSPPMEVTPLSSVQLENAISNEYTTRKKRNPIPSTLYLQMGKKAVKKIPDAVLLGSLVMISTELLQVNTLNVFE